MRAFIAWLTFALPVTGLASSIVAVDEATLVGKADTIAVASIITSEPYPANGGTRTRYWMQVHEGLRNAREGDTIQMDVPGGSLRGLRTVVTGAPVLPSGAMVIVFLESRGANRRPLGLSYGVYRIDADAAGRWRVGRRIDGLSLLGAHGRELSRQESVAIATHQEPYEDFIARIRGRLVARRMAAEVTP